MYRMIRTVLNKYRNIKTSNNVMIIGAGEATNVIMREIQNSSYLANSNIACIIDDDRRKVGKYIRGVKVIGTRDKIKEAAKLMILMRLYLQFHQHLMKLKGIY